jgi:hypothetical protein
MATATGAHEIELTMNDRWHAARVHEVPSRFAPATPRAALRGDSLAWSVVPGAVKYVVYQNGRSLHSTSVPRVELARSTGLSEFQVMAVNAAGDESFLSEPVRVVPKGGEVLAKPEGTGLEREHAGFTGGGYVQLTLQKNTTISMTVHIDRNGSYAVDARYANGNGPVNTEDKAALRTLLVDGDTAGVIVMPQRGVDRWAEWGWSNVLRARLRAGAHTLTLTYTPLDANMNRHENTALLDAVRLTRLSDNTRGSR